MNSSADWVRFGSWFGGGVALLAGAIRWAITIGRTEQRLTAVETEVGKIEDLKADVAAIRAILEERKR